MRFRPQRLGEWEQAKRAERGQQQRERLWRPVVATVPQFVQAAGVAAVVYGISLVSVPAAWIVAGVGLVAVIEVAGWQRRRADRQERAAAAALRMSRGDLNL